MYGGIWECMEVFGSLKKGILEWYKSAWKCNYRSLTINFHNFCFVILVCYTNVPSQKETVNLE